MNNYKLSIQQQQGKPSTLTLSGQLTLKNCFALHAELLEYAKQEQGLRLEVKDVEELDAAFLQLLLALSRYHDEHKRPFYLHLDLNSALSKLVQVSGMNTALNTTPDKHV